MNLPPDLLNGLLTGSPYMAIGMFALYLLQRFKILPSPVVPTPQPAPVPTPTPSPLPDLTDRPLLNLLLKWLMNTITPQEKQMLLAMAKEMEQEK